MVFLKSLTRLRVLYGIVSNEVKDLTWAQREMDSEYTNLEGKNGVLSPDAMVGASIYSLGYQLQTLRIPKEMVSSIEQRRLYVFDNGIIPTPEIYARHSVL